VTKKQKNYKLLVGARIKQLRSESELTQDILSERCGIFRTYLSRIESGSANPTLVVLVALAESLGVEPAELFREA
jgi:transcriptional regulator with XRE-family HTH domain